MTAAKRCSKTVSNRLYEQILRLNVKSLETMCSIMRATESDLVRCHSISSYKRSLLIFLKPLNVDPVAAFQGYE